MGVGAVTSDKLHDRGIHTVADLAMLDVAVLVGMLGPGAGHHLHALAQGKDPRRVRTGVRRRSIGSQRALGRRRRSPDELDVVLVGLVDRVARRLRLADRVGRTVVLRLRFDDFTRATRSHTLARATSHTPTVLAGLRRLLADAQPLIGRQGITLLGITVANLSDASAVQLALPFDARDGTALDATLDDLATRFGSDAVTRAVLLGRDPGLSVPLLPD